MELKECLEALSKAGIQRVAVTWNSDEDEGWDGRGIRFFTHDGKEVTDTLEDVFAASGDTETDLYELDGAIDIRFCDVREKIDPDWDCGSRGRLLLHVNTGSIRSVYFKEIRTEREARHAVEFVSAGDALTTIYQQILPEVTSGDAPDDLATTLAEPACTCNSLLKGHDERCPYRLFLQQKGTN